MKKSKNIGAPKIIMICEALEIRSKAVLFWLHQLYVAVLCVAIKKERAKNAIVHVIFFKSTFLHLAHFPTLSVLGESTLSFIVFPSCSSFRCKNPFLCTLLCPFLLSPCLTAEKEDVLGAGKLRQRVECGLWDGGEWAGASG